MTRKLTLGSLLIFLVITSSVLSSRVGQRSHSPFVRVQFQGNTGWIFGGLSYLSKDGGDSWRPLNISYYQDPDAKPVELRNRIQFVDPNTGFHAFQGRLMTSTDAGVTWNKVGKYSVIEVFFYNKLFGLVLKPWTMYRTFDGGQTWERLSSGEFSDVCFLSEKDIYATNGSQFFRSNDKGMSWTLIREFPPMTIWKIKQRRDRLWLIGRRGFCAIYSPITNDWQRLDVPTDSYLCDIGFTQDSMITIGAYGTLFVGSTTSGKWQKVDLGLTDDLVSIDFSQNGTAFVVGGHRAPSFIGLPANIALASRDYRSWQKLSLP